MTKGTKAKNTKKVKVTAYSFNDVDKHIVDVKKKGETLKKGRGI